MNDCSQRNPSIHSFMFTTLLFISFISSVSSDTSNGILNYQATKGTLESQEGLGLGIFPSTINNLLQEEPSPSTSSSITTGAYATIEIIRVTGNVATVIYGDGDSVSVLQEGDTIKITNNDQGTNGHHIVSVVISSTVFSFNSNAAPGSYNGGTVSKVYTNTDCPAGYYCNGVDKYVCGASNYYCPDKSTRRLSVFVGSNHQGAHYTTGGTNHRTRDNQILCPVGHYCTDGIKYECPAGRYGSRYGEHDATCENDCAAGYYCPSGSYRADQIPCSMGTDIHIDPYCPIGSALPMQVNAGYYTFGTVKINVVDRQDSGNWRSNQMYNDAPEEILANTRASYCEPGYYCINGIRKQCRPGFYGKDSGAAVDTCTGQCPGGYYCPMGTVTPIKCGKPSHFCPVQSEAPRLVNNGYYSFSHYDNPSNDTHSDEHQCELGTYCTDGVRHRCPGGRYGDVFGLNTSDCSGLCLPGYYCPLQSHIKTQNECGGVHVYCPEGSPEPIEAPPGYFTASFIVPALRHDDLSIKLWQHWDELLFPTLRTTIENQNRSRHFVVVEDTDPTHRTRIRQLICPKGNYCIRGRRHLCPAGTYGATNGLHTLTCSNPSPPGYFAPPGTTNETQYPCSDPGYYCPLASGSPTPVPPGWYSFAPHSFLRNTATQCHAGNTNATNTVCSIYMYNSKYYRLHNDAGYEMYRTTIQMCPVGTFCPGVTGDGHRWEMPPGRVGISSGVASYLGTGTQNCTAGYYCVAGSYSATSRRCGSNVLKPFIHEIQIISTESVWKGSQRREIGVSGSFVIDFDTTVRSDPLDVQWNRINSSTTQCEAPCFRRMVKGQVNPPFAVAHDATANEMKYFLEMLPNIGVVNVSRQVISEQDHTYAWSVTFVTVLGNVPMLKVRLLPIEIPNNIAFVDAHGRQNTHAAVHHVSQPLHGATATVIEHTTGTAQIFEKGQTSDVYCPIGSGHPTPVDSGYYTNLRNNIYSQVKHVTVKGNGLEEPSQGRSGINDEMAYEQVQCEVGHWCDKGLRDACPRGRYGKIQGLTTEYCSGPCAPGFICPHGSYSSRQLDCGYNVAEPTSVYCPPGLEIAAWEPTFVSVGYYTTGGDEKTNRTRWAQTICPLGHYCTIGKRIRCPAGKYGGVLGLSTAECSGDCNGGYFCPQGSWLATQNECGSDYGVRSPCKVKQRDGESMLTAHTGERRCEDDHGPTRDTIHSQGTGHVSVHHHETEDYTMGQPRQFHYHTTLFHTSRERYSGDPSSVYCPIGTGIPFQVTSGYYTDGGIEASAGTVTGTSFVAHDFTSGACAPAATNVACSSISTPVNQATCDPQSVGSCAGGADTTCTDVADGPETTCIGTSDSTGSPCAWAATNLCTYFSNSQDLIVVVDGTPQTVSVVANCNTVDNGATALSSLITGATVTAVGSNLVITSATTGPSSTLSITPTGSGVAALALFGTDPVVNNGDAMTNTTRISEIKCPTGYFCEEGKQYQCPPGRFGGIRGLTTEFCSGFCPSGSTCPWNTSFPIACGLGEYSQAGSMTCTVCPQRPGWSLSESSCKTSRSCCFT